MATIGANKFDSDGRPLQDAVGEDSSGNKYVLITNSSGQLEIALVAGTNVIGKVNIKRVPVTTPTTGTGVALATLNPGADYKLLGIRVHISTGAPLAAGETLTVTLDANAGTAYDVVLFTLDMGTPGINDVVIPFGGDEDFHVSGDKIVIALSANTGGDTWGCETIHELV